MLCGTWSKMPDSFLRAFRCFEKSSQRDTPPRVFQRLMNRSFVTFSWFLLCLCLASTRLVVAHPMGNFSINHYSKLTLGPSALEILYLIDMAEVPTFQEKPALDLDGDGAIGPAEKQQYLTKKVDELTQGLRLSLNGSPTQLEKVAEQVELIPGGLGLPTLKLTLRYQLNWDRVDLKETNRLDYEDWNFPGRVGWKEITAVGSDGIQLLESSVPAADLTEQLMSYPADPTIRPPEDLAASLKFR